MNFNWLFRKKLSIKQAEELLTQYCQLNGFDDSTPWKAPTQATHWFRYRKRSNKIISKNWLAYHLKRGSEKYSIWIDLVSKEIREVAR
jgi:hypothetical protein